MADQYSEDRLKQILLEVLQTSIIPILNSHTKTLDSHTKTLDSHTKTLDSHTKTLASHSRILDSHTKILDSHSRILESHTKILDSHSRTLGSHTKTLSTHSAILGSQSIRQNAMQTGLSQIKEAVRGNGFLLEDLEGRFTTLCEAVDENLSARQQINDHEDRLADIEDQQVLMKVTLKEHSRKLKH